MALEGVFFFSLLIPKKQRYFLLAKEQKVILKDVPIPR